MLLTLGISHKTAPIEIREKLAFSSAHIPCALKTLTRQAPVDEVALLSTCNRTEIYFSSPETTGSLPQVLTWWQQYQQCAFELAPYLYIFPGEEAVHHMMRLASGLDSMILGEGQILGQLRNAFRMADQHGFLGRRLSRLFQTSFSVAKKVRQETEIAQHPVSVAFAAVTLAKQIFTDLSKATVVLIGAGENIELILQHLLTKQIKKCLIANRTFAHAETLAVRYDAQPLPLNELSQALSQADIVISSVDCEKPILTAELWEQSCQGRKRRPVFMVDLGVPRNIEPHLSSNEDIYLYTIDDLQGIITENLKSRQRAALEAEKMIVNACNAYMNWDAAYQKVETIRALRQKAEEIKNKTLTSALRQLEKGADPKNVLAEFAHRLTQKLLHHPTVSLRQASVDNEKEKILLAKELFNIEQV